MAMLHGLVLACPICAADGGGGGNGWVALLIAAPLVIGLAVGIAIYRATRRT
jgi:hypothetical protein